MISFDICTEVVLFLTAIYMVQGLQLALRKKMVVAFAFGLRLPSVIPLSLEPPQAKAHLTKELSRIIAAAALRLYYQGIELASADPSIEGVLTTVCAEIELCYGVVATTIPCLRPFMFALSTNYGGPTHMRPSPGDTMQPSYNISLGSLSTSSKLDKAGKKDHSVPPTRWDGPGYNVKVGTGDQHSFMSNDSRRGIISKDMEWVVDYGNCGKHV